MKRDDLDKFTAQWEDALKKGIFEETPKARPTDSQDFFGNYNQVPADIKDIDAEYWNKVWELTGDYNDVPDPLDAFNNEEESDEEEGHDPSMTGDDDVVIQEDDCCWKNPPEHPDPNDWEDAQGVKVNKFDPKFVDGAMHAANPINRASRGKDQRPHVTPNWTWGVELAELTEMKVNLEKLESKMNAADAFAKSSEAAKVKKQIDDLWEKLDALSDKLSPDFLKDYMS